MVCQDARHDGPPNFWQVITRENQNLVCVKVSPGFLAENCCQSAWSRYKVRLAPIVIGIWFVELEEKFISKDFWIGRARDGVDRLEEKFRYSAPG